MEGEIQGSQVAIDEDAVEALEAWKAAESAFRDESARFYRHHRLGRRPALTDSTTDTLTLDALKALQALQLAADDALVHYEQICARGWMKH